MIKLDEMGAAPLGECPPLLGCLIERQSRMPVHHESHRESDCDGASSPRNGYQRINEAALDQSRKFREDRAETMRDPSLMSLLAARKEMENGYDRPASSRNAWTVSNSMWRFFSMMIVWVPSGSMT
jgi:hypothetical protein